MNPHSSMYSTQLDPTRDALTRHAIRGDGLINTVTQPANTSLPNPSRQSILVQFPSLCQDKVVAPGTVHFVYDVTLTRGTDLTVRFVINHGRAFTDIINLIEA